MTVAALPAVAEYREDGTTTSFPVPFRFRAASDLVVERLLDGGTLPLAIGTDYSVAGGQTDAGGTVVRAIATIGGTLRIRRRTTRAQPMAYTTGDRFPARSHEEALDRGILISQDQDVEIGDLRDRAIKVPHGGDPGTIRPDESGILGIYNGNVSLQPLLNILPSLTDLHDDGPWDAAAQLTNDGVWG